MMAGRTTLIIAHRLSTLGRFDDVVVFDHGRVIEHGERTELATRHGSRYQHLLELALEPNRPTGDDVDDIDQDAIDTDLVMRWAGVLAFVEIARMGTIHIGAIQWTKAWVHMQTLLRANLLAAQ